MRSYWYKMVTLVFINGALLVSAALGQTALQIGSGNTATADPPVARPDTTPCVVQLFSNVGPLNTTPVPFSFTPPSDCPPPWSKVIVSADYSVNAGHQNDRTTSIWIGATNILYGSAMEPDANTGRTWHVERDVTDYSALFTKPQPGAFSVLTAVTKKNPSIISGTASLLFFPSSASAQAAVTPDVVLPLSADPVLGGQVAVFGTQALSGTFTMPTNVERAFVDIIVRNAGSASDEFYYLCVPDPVIAQQLLTCPGTSFREAEITIDGQPAGVAPAFPRITEGSIDPFLWRPIPGLLALNFLPYRVDITPFAGLLSDGNPHEIAVSVVNANPFTLNGAVLLFLDHAASQVSGGIELNTLGSPNPVTEQSVSTADGTTSGTFKVTSSREFTIRGFVNTSHGKVVTEISQTVDFANDQQFSITGSSFTQDVKETVAIDSVTRTKSGGSQGAGNAEQVTVQKTEFPMSVDLTFTTNADGTHTQTTAIQEHHNQSVLSTNPGDDLFFRFTKTAAAMQDTLSLSPTFSILGNQDQASSQSFFTRSSERDCFSRQINAAAGLLETVQDGKFCPANTGDSNR